MQLLKKHLALAIAMIKGGGDCIFSMMLNQAIAKNECWALFCGEICEVPHMFSDDKVESIKDMMIPRQKFALKFLCKKDGWVLVETSHRVGTVLSD